MLIAAFVMMCVACIGVGFIIMTTVEDHLTFVGFIVMLLLVLSTVFVGISAF